jgi:hypothetical protein
MLVVEVKVWLSGFGGLVVSMLASGTKVRGFKPGRSRPIFGRKNPQHAFLRRGSKAVGPVSQLCGMYKTPTIPVEVALQAKFDQSFLIHNSTFR